MASQERLGWIDTAKGISILLVVTMYSAFNVGEHTGGIGFMHYVIGFATPFRMPEFFLISGLFLSQVIARPFRLFADRRVVHYLYFYLLWMVISIGLKIGIFSMDPAGMARDMALALVQPYGVLWFIYMLALFSLAARLLWQLRVPHWVVLPVAAGLQMTGLVVTSYAVTQFSAYFVFFYLGYAAAPLVFRLVDWCRARPGVAVVGLAVWALANGFLVFSGGSVLYPDHMQMGLAAFPPLHLALAVIGTLALCVLADLLVRLPAMDWLRWLGEHSLVVYVAFTIPMSIVRAAITKTGLVTDPGLAALVVLIASTVSPVILYLIIQRVGFGRFLFERPAWAHIAAPKGKDRAAKHEDRPAGRGPSAVPAE